MIKIAIIGVVATLLAIQVEDKKAYSTYIGIITMVVICLFLLNKVQVVLVMINKLCTYINIDISYIKLLLKMIGITYVAEISAGICTDAGYGNIGKHIEIAAKFTILALSMEVVMNVVDMVIQILK